MGPKFVITYPFQIQTPPLDLSYLYEFAGITPYNISALYNYRENTGHTYSTTCSEIKMDVIQKIEGKVRVCEEEEEETNPMYGDVLEAVVSMVPLTDLVASCKVSKSWRGAVFTSLAKLKKAKPWLIVHTQSTRSLETKTTHAYDPRSGVWMEIDKPSTKYVSLLRSFGSNLIYVLSSSKLLLSEDPFNLEWRESSGPTVCRSDPIVALCNKYVVVAGSCWDFEDDLLAVEVYDRQSSTWRSCESLPEILKDAAAAEWLSVASDDTAVFVTENASGITYSFDPCLGTWNGPYHLRPDPQAFYSTIGFAGQHLILVALIGPPGNPDTLRISRVNIGTNDCDLICEAPPAILKKLKGNRGLLRHLELSPANDFVYLYNKWDPEVVVFCDFAGGDCVWGSTPNVAWNVDVKIGGKMVFTCGKVDIQDLDAAMKSGSRNFTVIY